MAITANVDIGNGVSATGCYIIIPTASVMKYKSHTGDKVFKLVYNVNIYQNSGARDTEAASKHIKVRKIDVVKIDYDTSASDNPFVLAYTHLKTNSSLSSVADA